jgi:hypothetical protein
VPDYRRDGMQAAADSLADNLREEVGKHSSEGAAAVNVRPTNSVYFVRAGTPTGRWHWTPIQVAMFNENGRHPVFGNREHWAPQNRRYGNVPIDFPGDAIKANGDDCAEAYARAGIDPLIRDLGFDDE